MKIFELQIQKYPVYNQKKQNIVLTSLRMMNDDEYCLCVGKIQNFSICLLLSNKGLLPIETLIRFLKERQCDPWIKFNVIYMGGGVMTTKNSLIANFTKNYKFSRILFTIRCKRRFCQPYVMVSDFNPILSYRVQSENN